MRYGYTPLNLDAWLTLKNLGISFAIRDTTGERTIAFVFNETWAKLIVKSLNVYEGMHRIREFFKEVSEWER